MSSSFFPDSLPFTLPAHGAAPEQRHVFEEEHVWAVRAALCTGRPLLIRGEPGTGKSQLARAAAHKLQRPWLTEVITSRSSSEDLLWEFDAIARLGHAQVLGTVAQTLGDAWREELRPARYLKPGLLWWAFHWDSAKAHLESHYQLHDPSARPPYYDQDHADPENGVVLLIDEIDKADADLPNGLLDALGNGGFCPPHGVEPVQQRGTAPLVVITTNEERELPAAFLRRCLVLNMQLPTDDAELRGFLVKRGEVHFPEIGDEAGLRLREEVADLLIKERRDAGQKGIPKPGQAEYLDLLRAILPMRQLYAKELNQDSAKSEAEVLLGLIGHLALKKQPLEQG